MNPISEKQREEAIQSAFTRLEKRYGKGAIMTLGDAPVHGCEVRSTGVLALDIALGTGGFPRGRVVEVFGPESSGKTTLALHAIAEVQAAGGIAAFIDVEHALDTQYAAALGVKTETLIISQPDHGEQALETTETLVRTGAVDLVVIDSVAALVPRAELEGDMGDAHMGLQARLMSQAMRKITAITGRSGCTVLFINQIRQKIGVTFGNGEVTSGGNALKFYASMRIDIRRIGAIKSGDQVVGNRTRIRVIKNKLAPPFRTAEVDIIYGTGVNREGDILTLGEDLGLVSKSGSWFSAGETRLGQGRENARAYLKEHPELKENLEAQIRTLMLGTRPVA